MAKAIRWNASSFPPPPLFTFFWMFCVSEAKRYHNLKLLSILGAFGRRNELISYINLRNAFTARHEKFYSNKNESNFAHFTIITWNNFCKKINSSSGVRVFENFLIRPRTFLCYCKCLLWNFHLFTNSIEDCWSIKSSGKSIMKYFVG